NRFLGQQLKVVENFRQSLITHDQRLHRVFVRSTGCTRHSAPAASHSLRRSRTGAVCRSSVLPVWSSSATTPLKAAALATALPLKTAGTEAAAITLPLCALLPFSGRLRSTGITAACFTAKAAATASLRR